MFWIIVGFAGLLSASALLTVKLFPLELLANLRPQLAALAILLAVASAGVGRLPPAIALSILAIAMLARAPELFQRASAPVPDIDVRVLWCNIFKDPVVARRLSRLAQREQADVVVVGEATRDFALLRTALAAYPYVYGAPELDQHGVVIFSRSSLDEGSISGPYLRGSYVTVSATLTTAAGPLRLVGLHPAVSGSPSRLAARDAQILAAAISAESSGPSLMLGDLNATPWTTAMRTVEQRTNIRRLSTGLSSTWFSPFPFLGIPIDHALVSSGVVASARVGPGIGSDHLPLIIDVKLPGV